MTQTATASMNRLEFATSLIRAPWFRRLTDRSFVLAVGAVILGVYLFERKAITGDQLVELLKWTLGPWFTAEKLKDAVLGQAAIKAAPES